MNSLKYKVIHERIYVEFFNEIPGEVFWGNPEAIPDMNLMNLMRKLTSEGFSERLQKSWRKSRRIFLQNSLWNLRIISMRISVAYIFEGIPRSGSGGVQNMFFLKSYCTNVRSNCWRLRNILRKSCRNGWMSSWRNISSVRIFLKKIRKDSWNSFPQEIPEVHSYKNIWRILKGIWERIL